MQAGWELTDCVWFDQSPDCWPGPWEQEVWHHCSDIQECGNVRLPVHTTGAKQRKPSGCSRSIAFFQRARLNFHINTDPVRGKKRPVAFKQLKMQGRPSHEQHEELHSCWAAQKQHLAIWKLYEALFGVYLTVSSSPNRVQTHHGLMSCTSADPLIRQLTCLNATTGELKRKTLFLGFRLLQISSSNSSGYPVSSSWQCHSVPTEWFTTTTSRTHHPLQGGSGSHAAHSR